MTPPTPEQIDQCDYDPTVLAADPGAASVVTRLCDYRRPEDGARCVVNKHPDRPELHSFTTQLDPRLHLLNDLAVTFSKADEWRAYHHVRAVAHELGFHLADCVGGVRVEAHE